MTAVCPYALLPITLSMLLAACDSGGGTIVDAITGQPIAGAVVTITDAGIGKRDGQLVFDAARSRSATSDAHGIFHLRSGASGYRLAVEASGYPPLEASLPSQWPATVRIGGPYMSDAKPLTLSLVESGPGWRFAPAPRQDDRSRSDLWIGPVPDLGGRSPVAIIHAPRGLAFVDGVGQPPTPPQTGYRRVLAVTLTKSGWLFVKAADGSIPAIEIGSYGVRLDTLAGDSLTLTYLTIGAAPPR